MNGIVRDGFRSRCRVNRCVRRWRQNHSLVCHGLPQTNTEREPHHLCRKHGERKQSSSLTTSLPGSLSIIHGAIRLRSVNGYEYAGFIDRANTAAHRNMLTITKTSSRAAAGRGICCQAATHVSTAQPLGTIRRLACQSAIGAGCCEATSNPGL